MSLLNEQLKQDMKSAMRAKEKERLATIRMALAALKQREVDDRIEITDEIVIATLTKLIKQRQDAAAQFKDAGREELASKELSEADVLQAYMPQPLTDAEIDALVNAAVEKVQAESMRDMGKVMAILKPQIQGRADPGKISSLVKAKLN